MTQIFNLFGWELCFFLSFALGLKESKGFLSDLCARQGNIIKICLHRTEWKIMFSSHKEFLLQLFQYMAKVSVHVPVCCCCLLTEIATFTYIHFVRKMDSKYSSTCQHHLLLNEANSSTVCVTTYGYHSRFHRFMMDI